MLLYAVTIFVSAFLLFLVQPVMAKQILPWFGGSAAVWTTCLVFFQSSLLAGYAYSDVAVHRLAPRAQVRLHSVLLLVSLALLPIIPGADWKPVGSENPSWRILGLLADTYTGARLVRRLCAFRRLVHRRGLAQPRARGCPRQHHQRGGREGRRRRRLTTDPGTPASVVHARSDRLAPPARRVEPHHSGHRVDTLALDRAARHLPAHVH